MGHTNILLAQIEHLKKQIEVLEGQQRLGQRTELGSIKRIDELKKENEQLREELRQLKESVKCLQRDNKVGHKYTNDDFCPKCGTLLSKIRGRYPKEPNRKVCACCIVEQLEDMVSQFNMGTSIELPPKEGE